MWSVLLFLASGVGWSWAFCKTLKTSQCSLSVCPLASTSNPELKVCHLHFLIALVTWFQPPYDDIYIINIPLQQQHLNDFTERMRDSGYPESMRYQIVQSGLQGYKKMLEVERAGGRPVNRLQKSDQIARKKQKTIKKDNWYKNGTYSTVLFVPCTPGSN